MAPLTRGPERAGGALGEPKGGRAMELSPVLLFLFGYSAADLARSGAEFPCLVYSRRHKGQAFLAFRYRGGAGRLSRLLLLPPTAMM